MVAIVFSVSRARPKTITNAIGWTAAAVGVLILGVLLRVALGGTGVGDRSGAVLTALLAACGWIAARLVWGPRVAFVAIAALLALCDLAALPLRNTPEYDDLQAFYRTDQVLDTELGVPTADAVLTIVAQPVFAGAQPGFGLSGELNGQSVQWSCLFRRGVQRLALPMPREALGAPKIDVKLHLNGSPTRESDYLLVYASSLRGGFLVSLDSPASLATDATLCSIA